MNPFSCSSCAYLASTGLTSRSTKSRIDWRSSSSSDGIWMALTVPPDEAGKQRAGERTNGKRADNTPLNQRWMLRRGVLVGRADVPLLLEVQDDLLRRFFGRQIRGVDHDLGVLRLLVRIRYPRELLHDPRARLGVQALAIARLTQVDRRRHVDEDEP